MLHGKNQPCNLHCRLRVFYETNRCVLQPASDLPSWTEVMMHAPSLGQKDTALRRHDGMAFEQMIESGAAAIAGVGAR